MAHICVSPFSFAVALSRLALRPSNRIQQLPSDPKQPALDGSDYPKTQSSNHTV